jgi:2-iminobutanoate/2-iminopropanoate deaminase
LTYADLRGADLTGANLNGVDFKEAQLTGAIMPNGDIHE